MVVSEVLDLARHGLFPVRLHYPIFNADRVSCSCGKPNCTSQGKHPVGVQWGKSATDDPEVIQQNFSSANWNVGIVLGLCHGIPADRAIIDIEDDSPEGKVLADSLLAGYPSPTYTSGKSHHRLYRWTDDLPSLANMTINGLEFRFGGKGLETQSVAPPSKHMNGSTYRWVDGMSLEDLPITPLPPHVIEFLQEESARKANQKGGTTSSSDPHKFRSPLGKITPGSRHHTLLTYANSLWRRQFQLYGINEYTERKSCDEVWMILAGANLLVCEPPKTESEVKLVYESSLKFMEAQITLEQQALEKINEEMTDPAPAEHEEENDTFGSWLHKHGIRLQNDRSMEPTKESPERIDEWVCDWKMEYLTKGDEELMAVHFEGIKSPSVMKHTEFLRADSFARRVQQDTKGEMCLDRTFIYWDWETIWRGRPNDSKGKKGKTRGLKEFLLNKAKVIEHETQSLAEQVEDLIYAMAGQVSGIIDGIDQWRNARDENPEGRLKINAMGSLCTIRAPEDPLTGWYLVDDKLLLLVKMDELNRRYRSAYGNTVANRMVAEALSEKLGFEKKKFTKGPLSGRWFLKESKEIENK
jgi:hypothetical protein